jgi:NAD(P)-dependent dehydrogenase (short-subunit alcohol dehydrogenase family)
VSSYKTDRKQEVNVLGVHNTARSWIKSQPDPNKPVGTFINVNSGLAGYLMPGNSAYASSKLAVHRYMEFLDLGKSFGLCSIMMTDF